MDEVRGSHGWGRDGLVTSVPGHKETLGLRAFSDSPRNVSGHGDRGGDGEDPVLLLSLRPVTVRRGRVYDVDSIPPRHPSETWGVEVWRRRGTVYSERPKSGGHVGGPGTYL